MACFVCCKELGNSGTIGTTVLGLFNAFNCLSHDLIVAKFEVYDLYKTVLSRS